MRNKPLIIILVGLTITILFDSCGKQEKLAIQEFLDQNYVQVDSMIGEWTWIKSQGGWNGMTIRTPETEGYSKKITFTVEGNYSESIDNELDFETYFRIDTVRFDSEDRENYKISYYSGKYEQNFLFDTKDDTLRLFMYDACRDCVGTHVYVKKME